MTTNDISYDQLSRIIGRAQSSTKRWNRAAITRQDIILVRREASCQYRRPDPLLHHAKWSVGLAASTRPVALLLGPAQWTLPLVLQSHRDGRNFRTHWPTSDHSAQAFGTPLSGLGLPQDLRVPDSHLRHPRLPQDTVDQHVHAILRDRLLPQNGPTTQSRERSRVWILALIRLWGNCNWQGYPRQVPRAHLRTCVHQVCWILLRPLRAA